MSRVRVRFRSIRQRLLTGFWLLVGLFLLAGLAARTSMLTMSTVIGETLASVQEDAQLAARLSASVTQELAAAARYLQQGDSLAQEDFRRFGRAAHAAQRAMNRDPGQSLEEVTLIASIDAALSTIETHYALSHRLRDLGRDEEALAAASRARDLITTLTEDVERLAESSTRKVTIASTDLRANVERRAAWVLSLVAVAVVLGLMVVFSTVNGISHPMKRLVGQARALSTGNFGVRTEGDLPGEFRELAEAMNTAADSLARVVAVTTTTADDVASSARELAGVSEQISASANQMASSMTEVSSGAESQVRQLRTVDEALRSINTNAEEMLVGTSEVTNLARSIEDSARTRRSEIERALGILTSIRGTVRDAASEVVALNQTAEDITRFVATVSRIAEQTDLLALNAAIEAARAGAAGRGFAVVADEVRKLAEQAQVAAEDVVQLTRQVTARVSSTTRAMEAGVTNVAEIESVSRDIDEALTSITAAAEKTRAAADDLAARAERNAHIVSSAAQGIQSIARTAEGHAAAAQQVSAATQEQSAACEQMSTASTQLLQGSMQLRELVGALKAVA
ncbi:MAG TPA: methyl-accepting chemotaxis protein [Gemmatimonadaceae bacterium]